MINNISEPYLSFTITCLKLKSRQKKSHKEKFIELNEIFQDKQLRELLLRKNLKNEKLSKRFFYKAILNKNYMFAYFLVYMQAIIK